MIFRQIGKVPSSTPRPEQMGRVESRRFWRELAMMLGVYVTLGIFLLLAARNPSANRSLIAFTAWSSLAHAALMALQAYRNFIARGELVGVGVLFVIGVALIVLAPAQTLRR